MSNIKFKIAAKTDVGRVRKNNEDNLQAACDLTTAPMKWVNDEECDLGNKGALLVVADGMGGMNAGEVASEIAINTIKEFFSPDKITEDVLSSKVGVEVFMKNSIIEADKRIKAAAKANPEHKGMGTTIVVAWLLNGMLYVAWCGDSRAYIYNRVNGLRQISKDHSYVQTLVDKGKITHEDAFDYPDSNIITRCLSDSDQKARPDVLTNPIALCNGDIILLCTDGLSGMIRDHEIEQILAENEENVSVCADHLIEAACEASGQDNITVALCKIISGAVEPPKNTKKNKLLNTLSYGSKERKERGNGFYKLFFFIILLMLVGFGCFFLGNRNLFSSPKLDKEKDTILEKEGYYSKIFKIEELQNRNDSLQEKINSLQEEKKGLQEKINGLQESLDKEKKEKKQLREEQLKNLFNQLEKKDSKVKEDSIPVKPSNNTPQKQKKK